MKVVILSKPEFNKIMSYNSITDDNVENVDAMFISINSPNRDELIQGAKTSIYSHFKRHHSNVMIMHFGDYPEEFIQENVDKNPTGLFNAYKAKKLYEFIKKNSNKSIAVVHCGAGISRSGAVGTFIYELYGNDTWEDFKRLNWKIHPNAYVLKLLREELKKDKENEK